MDDADTARLLQRLNTWSLRADNERTVVLVVRNPHALASSGGRVRFKAAFPVRAETGAQPVTVYDIDQRVVPSRVTEQSLQPRPDLPPGRRLWSLTLEFAVDSLPAHGWHAYAAIYAMSPASRSQDEAFWDSLPALALPVNETDCHEGDLPLAGSYDIMVPMKESEGSGVQTG